MAKRKKQIKKGRDVRPDLKKSLARAKKVLKSGCSDEYLDYIAGPCEMVKTPEDRCLEAIRLLQIKSMNPFGITKEDVQEMIDTVKSELRIKTPPDAVNNPSHYGGKNNPYEAIKVIRAWGLGFSLGNAVKYISRAGKKDPKKHIEDLEKSIWYIQEEITHLKEKDPGFAVAE